MRTEISLIYFKNVSQQAVGFFFLVIPYFKNSEPLGWCNEGVEEFADIVHRHKIIVGRMVAELKRKGIIRVSKDGRYYCPLVIQGKL